MIRTIVEIEHIKDFDEQGFYSKTYLALDKRLNRYVAVKDIIYGNITSDEEFEKHIDEAYKLSIAAHPRILPVYYVGLDFDIKDEKIPRIVSHYYKNGSLNAYLVKVYDENKTLALDEIIRCSHDVIQGMIHLHALDIVHFDLKASNIYIGDDKKMIIGDFGQAKFIEDGIIHEEVDLYPALAPAEAFRKKAYDKTTDIYQFGLLLYSMVCFNEYRYALDETYKISTKHLKQIYRANPENVELLKEEFKNNMKLFSSAVRNSTFPDRNSYPYYIPKEIQDIIHKCLDPQVQNRYNNFYQIQDDLNKFIFPNGVSDFYQDLETNQIHFNKEDMPCIITITQNGARFDIESRKNDRLSNANCKIGILRTKLPAELFKFAANL